MEVDVTDRRYQPPPRRGAMPALISPTSASEVNRSRVLQILYDVGPVSRATLARLTNVTKSTIGAIVQGMINDDILFEGPPEPSSAGGGKPARPLWFSPTSRPIIAVHLLPGLIRAALVEPAGNIIAQSIGRFPAPARDMDLVMDAIVSTIRQIHPEPDVDVLGVGVAVGGVVNTDTGHVVKMNLAPGLTGLPLGPLLSERLHLPVHLDLHPRVQAIGDRWFGLGRRVSSFASVYCAEAIGVGLVLDGAVHRGMAGAGGEIGHSIVQAGGEECRCGQRGCWETIASHRWLRAAALERGLPHARSMTADRLSQLVAADHPGAQELADLYAQNVAYGLINLQQILAPELIILHGDVVGGGEPFRLAIEQRFLAGLPENPAIRPRIVFSGDADDITLLGAAGLVLSKSLALVV